MAYCFDDLGDYAVTPMLVSPCGSEKCCQPPPLCYPCLPRCPKGQVVYYCEKPQSIQRKSSKNCDSCCHETPKAESYCKRRCLSPSREDCCPSCNNPCKPIKTKYVIPCYRYEDGRIVNQPTVLMRRACEVAVGARPRRKPFAVSSVCIDPDQEVHRYHSQDDRGNCCYYFEKKNTCHSTQSSPQCGDFVPATPAVVPPRGCYFQCV
ncbi:keratin-associated protein 9-1-like isoform X1 [Maniola hyperantus]|uniref:keratin-associated protein 9-1-like isoform X1 n=1 Tax=Aphantopus hyperantus TaxID=2795564 RepID=UPI003747FFD0